MQRLKQLSSVEMQKGFTGTEPIRLVLWTWLPCSLDRLFIGDCHCWRPCITQNSLSRVSHQKISSEEAFGLHLQVFFLIPLQSGWQFKMIAKAHWLPSA
ncbi:uncharacterized protein LOC102097638 isoform X2 [Columba livia]|uniref:uncharacterized protein LOC102097638 isoform X2 n=1 Tax=Columba livia TaxID=8932 RepID=UPI0031B9E967